MLRFLSKLFLEFIRGFSLEVYRTFSSLESFFLSRFLFEFASRFPFEQISWDFYQSSSQDLNKCSTVSLQECLPGFLPEIFLNTFRVSHWITFGDSGISRRVFHGISLRASEISLIFCPGIIPRILSQGVPVVLMISSKIYLEISLVVLPGSSCWVSPGFHPLLLREFSKMNFEDNRARSHSAENSWKTMQ